MLILNSCFWSRGSLWWIFTELWRQPLLSDSWDWQSKSKSIHTEVLVQKNDLHLTCPSNLRALPETNGLPARIHASFKRYLVKQYQGPVIISLSKKTASQLSYKWPYKGIAGIFQRGEGTVPHKHCLPYLPNIMSTATLIFNPSTPKSD